MTTHLKQSYQSRTKNNWSVYSMLLSFVSNNPNPLHFISTSRSTTKGKSVIVEDRKWELSKKNLTSFYTLKLSCHNGQQPFQTHSKVHGLSAAFWTCTAVVDDMLLGHDVLRNSFSVSRSISEGREGGGGG